MSDLETTTRRQRLTALCLNLGAWLTGPEARDLPPDEWEAHFLRYQERLKELRALCPAEPDPDAVFATVERLLG